MLFKLSKTVATVVGLRALVRWWTLPAPTPAESSDPTTEAKAHPLPKGSGGRNTVFPYRLREWWDCDAAGCLYIVGQNECVGCGSEYGEIEAEIEAEIEDRNS